MRLNAIPYYVLAFAAMGLCDFGAYRAETWEQTVYWIASGVAAFLVLHWFASVLSNLASIHDALVALSEQLRR